MPSHYSLVAASCCLALASLDLAEAAMPIVDDGRPRSEIVVSEKPTRSAKLAAKELQAYVAKISGAKLPIVTAATGAMPAKIYVGESDAARAQGVTAEGLPRDAFRMVSGDDWLALVGNDWDFTPVEPWGRSHTDWVNRRQAEWEQLAAHPWINPIGASIYRDYNKELDIWNYDHRGSLNAVYEFLRSLGVRWYMPGELGELVPKSKRIVLPRVDRTVRPAFEVRSIDRPRISSPDVEDALWYLRCGLNKQYGLMHHGQREITELDGQRKAHPEYYAMLPNGRRDTDSDRPSACLSSPGFFQEMVDYTRLMFDHYDVPIVSVMPEDGFSLCQCEQCRGQVTLDRDATGIHSDYVWTFVIRVANELAKTHPNKKVVCGAYSSYRLPPRSIDKLPDNVLVQITNGRPIRELDDQLFAETAELRRLWQEKTNNPLSLSLNFTPFINRGEYRPQYWMHVIDRGIKAVRGAVWREDVWGSGDGSGLAVPAMCHVNYYFMSRLWWDPNQDLDALLGEYYPLFYGPAAKPMKDFIDFCEVNFGKLGEDAVITGEALSRFEQVKAALPPESVYGRRIANVDAYLTTLRNRSRQIDRKRPEGLPSFRMIDMAQDKWRNVRHTLVLDGKVEEPFWTCYRDSRPLRTLRDAHKHPKFPTTFRARWYRGSIYFAVVCQGESGKQPIIGTTQNHDPAIWDGEHLELLVETDKHSYYQIVVNPAGARIDLDRGVAKDKWYEWSSQAEVAAHIGDGLWSVEIKLPITPSDEDPLHQIVGSKPFKAKARNAGKEANLPWYFNLFRNRKGSDDGEASAFSPISPQAKSFHERLRFAELYTSVAHDRPYNGDQEAKSSGAYHSRAVLRSDVRIAP